MASVSDYFEFKGFLMRKAEDDDIAALVPLINEAYSYQDHVKGEPRTNPTHLKERFTETDFYVVATESGQVAGCVYVQPQDDTLHFGLLTLAPSYRGTGLAQAMMAAVEEFAKTSGCSELDLDYMSLAPWLKAYYQKYGFKETGSVVPWGKIDLIRMKKDLS